MITMFFNVVTCEEKRICKSSKRRMKDGKQELGEDGKAIIDYEYESMGWFLTLMPGNISYRIGANSEGFKRGDLVKLTISLAEESEVPQALLKSLGRAIVPPAPSQ